MKATLETHLESHQADSRVEFQADPLFPVIIFVMVRFLMLRAEVATRDCGTPCPAEAHAVSAMWNFPSEASWVLLLPWPMR